MDSPKRFLSTAHKNSICPYIFEYMHHIQVRHILKPTTIIYIQNESDQCEAFIISRELEGNARDIGLQSTFVRIMNIYIFRVNLFFL